jgi:aspartate/methionine/tyrosine aminotransferase
MAGSRLKVRKVIAIRGFSKGFEIIGWIGGYFSGAGD